MKIINTKFGVLNTQDGDKIEFAYHRPIWINIALLMAIIALVGVYVARNMGWV